MTRISVGLSPDLATAYLRADAERSDVDDLEQIIRGGGGELSPQTLGLDEGTIDRGSDEVIWFTCQVDDQAAQESVGRLLGLEGVLAAYVVAPEGPP